MKQMRKWQIGLRLFFAVSIAGTTFVDLGCFGTLAKNFNPCGTVLNCDPLEWDLMFTDFPDWDVDPTCTIPGMCGGPFPYAADQGAGGGTVGTGDTN